MKQFESIRFGVSALQGTNKAGVLKQDDKGYINGMALGALNSFNARGEFYSGDDADVLALFREGSEFLIRLKDGRISGENGHPEQEPGETDEAFVCRFSRVTEKRICCFHAEIWLGEKSVASDGFNVIPVYGKTAPAGELMYVFTEALRRPEENICFSLRGGTFDRMYSGVKYRLLRHIITYDKVQDPGLKTAKRWNSLALESGKSLVLPELTPHIDVYPDLLDSSIEFAKRAYGATESTSMLMTFGEVLKNVHGFKHNPDMNGSRGWRGWVNDAVRNAG